MKLNVGWILSHKLDHHSGGFHGVRCMSFPGLPVQTWCPTNMVTSRMPVTVQTGRATAAVPPTATIWRGTFPLCNVTKDAWGAAVIVTVDGAEAVAILVNAWVGTTDGITFGQSWKPFKESSEVRIQRAFKMLLLLNSGHCDHKWQLQ